jgi:hypothetical protein
LLTLLEIVWLALIFIQIFCRGPNWNFYWPGEPWDAMRIVPWNTFVLSEYIWIYQLGTALPDSMFLRESPGILLSLAYFMIGIVLTLILRWKHAGFVRHVIAVLILQLAFLVPIKMFCQLYFNMRYFVEFQEIYLNI